MAKDVIKAMEKVYGTLLIFKVHKSLKDALNAKQEDYVNFWKEYSKYFILPKEFATDF